MLIFVKHQHRLWFIYFEYDRSDYTTVCGSVRFFTDEIYSLMFNIILIYNISLCLFIECV